MILYTEKQMQEAYYKFIRKLPLIVPMPTLQQFRRIYEDTLKLQQIEIWVEGNGDKLGK